jgi:hypothetical protein
MAAQCTTVLFALLVATNALANPPTPTGQHPRLFLGTRQAALTTNAGKSGTAAASLVKACQDTIDNPQDYMSRGGSDGDTWPAAAVNCAFSWVTTQNPTHLQQAITYWQASLDDDQNLGDHMGCVANATGQALTRTITHDTGYPMRWVWAVHRAHL